MGRALVRLTAEADDLSLVGAIDSPESSLLGRDAGELGGVGNLGVELTADLASGLLGADVLIDFTVAPAFAGMLRAAMHAGVAVVSGTTRISDDDHALVERASESIAVLWAPNMSLGVQVLAQLVEQAVAALGADYDVELVEAHHNQKVDAPSGTATMLVERARRARPELEAVHGRHGDVGKRKAAEIGVHALRGGSVFGDHSLHLIGAADRIEISHRAINRDLFAHGALRAARFVAGKAPGRYQLADTLDSRPPDTRPPDTRPPNTGS
jgi:4-hydroxy-tetrahydrodipicolinate reductase